MHLEDRHALDDLPMAACIFSFGSSPRSVAVILGNMGYILGLHSRDNGNQNVNYYVIMEQYACIGQPIVVVTYRP